MHPSYIHDAAPIDERRVLVLRANADNLQPGFLELWDVIDGTLQWQVSAIAELAHTLASDGRLAASGSTDGLIRIWQIADGALVRTIDTHKRPQRGGVGALAFLDRRRLLAGSSSGFELWDIATGERQRAFRIKGGIMEFAIGANGTQFLTASTDRIVRLWDTRTLACVRKLLEPRLSKSTARNEALDQHTASGACILAGGKRAVACYGDGTLRCWDLETGKMISRASAFSGDPAWLTSVGASPRGDRVIAGAWDTNVWLWDLASAPVAMAGHIGEPGPVFFLDERRAVSVSMDQTIRVWDTTTRTCERVIGRARRSSLWPPSESQW